MSAGIVLIAALAVLAVLWLASRQRPAEDDDGYLPTDEEIEAHRAQMAALRVPHEHEPYQAPGQWPMCEWCFDIVPEVFPTYDSGYLEFICHYCDGGLGFRQLTEDELWEAMRGGRVLAGEGE